MTNYSTTPRMFPSSSRQFLPFSSRTRTESNFCIIDMKSLLFSVLLLIASIPEIKCQGLCYNLPCGSVPCEDPVCCESGYLTKAPYCGCCAVCAPPAGTSCGGRWDMGCAQDAKCLRICPETTKCKSKSISKKCIFPFSYEGKRYNKCTSDHTGEEREFTWCATEVDSNGELVGEEWEYCKESCETSRKCDSPIGNCIKSSDVEMILKFLNSRDVPYVLNDSKVNQISITKCQPGVANPVQCRCSKGPVTQDLRGNKKGGCLIGGGNDPDHPRASGYCFLENVQNATDPTSNCFKDTKWLRSEGRFYSYEACQNEKLN